MVDSMYPCTESFGKQEIIISKCTEINQASYQIIQRFATSNTILNLNLSFGVSNLTTQGLNL
jgi:hypothetical protein